MIRIYGFKNTKEAGVAAANVIAEVIKSSDSPVIGLATGSSPLDTYGALVDMYNKGELSFKGVRSINLDEYYGLTPDHDQSYRYFMNTNLFNHVDIDINNTNVPNGVAEDPVAECERYDKLIEDMGGADVQVIGIGNNGHIAFNEPSDKFTYGTNFVKLTESTINANARFFESRDMVPTHAISMGIGGIMRAKKIILVANGKGKAEILEKSLFGDVTPEVPASILRFANDVMVFADFDALSVIEEKHPGAIIK